jgi:hypothetical protein
MLSASITLIMAVAGGFNLRAACVVPILFEAMAAFASVTVKNSVVLKSSAVEARSKAARSKAPR